MGGGMGGGHGGRGTAPHSSGGRGPVHTSGHFDMISHFGITMTDSSAIITTVSSSFLISPRLASHGGTPITTTGTRTITPIMATNRFTTPSIGLIWPCQCNRDLLSAVITTAR
jgi:hypothetical protein